MNASIREALADNIPRLFIAAVVILAVTACGGGGPDGGSGAAPPPSGPPAPPSPAPPPAQPLRVVPAGISLDRTGTGQLFAVGATAAVAWSSSDPAIVAIDARGRLQPVARGTATVTATMGTSTSTAVVRVFDTQAATPDKTSESLIAAALAANRVTAEQALIYRVYAAFGDTRLPAEFHGAPPSHAASLLMKEVSGRLSTLSADARSTLRPFFVPPIYAESWYAKQFGLDVVSANVQGGQVRVHQAPGGESCTLMATLVRRRATAHFNLWTVDAMLPAGAVEDGASPFDVVAGFVGESLEQVYQAETTLLDRHPRSDLDQDCNGGDGAVDVYLVPRLQQDHSAETTSYPTGCNAVPSFIKVGYFDVVDALMSGTGNGRNRIKSVLAHEFAHVLQFAMNRSAACANYNWIDEATAQALVDFVYPDYDTEDGRIKVLQARRRGGQFFANYLLNDYSAAIENPGSNQDGIVRQNGYTDYVFFQYLGRKYNWTVLKSIHDAMSSRDSVQALHAGVESIGGMDRVWHQFALALWNDPDNPVLERLPDGYDAGMVHVLAGEGRENSAPKPEQTPMALASGGRETFELLKTAQNFGAGYQIQPRSMHFDHLKFTDPAVSSVLITMPIVIGARQGALKLQAVPKIDGQWRAVEDWSRETQKFFCRDRLSERIEELILVMSYSENAPADQTAKISDEDPLMVSISNVGCWKWEGTASVRIQSSGFNAQSDGTSSAGEIVFEAPEGPTGTLRVLRIKSGFASGRQVHTQPNCTITITGPQSGIVETDTASLGFNLDLKVPRMPPPDRRIVFLNGIKFIDSTSVSVCNGVTTTTPAPGTGWAWLLWPLASHAISVSDDGRTIEQNVSIPFSNGSTVHQFRFTASRE